MKVPALIARLDSFPSVLVPAISEWTDADSRWRPAPDAWSVTEIVSHLVYAEVEDFRPRLGLTLEDPRAPWTPIDPEGVVTQRHFQDNDAIEQARILERERVESVRSAISWQWSGSAAATTARATPPAPSGSAMRRRIDIPRP